MFLKIEEQKPHQKLVDPIFVLMSVDQRDQQIFHQILDLRHLRHLKVEKLVRIVAPAEKAADKIHQDAVLVEHGKGGVKKFGEDH